MSGAHLYRKDHHESDHLHCRRCRRRTGPTQLCRDALMRILDLGSEE